MGKYLKVTQACERTELDKKTLYKAIEQGHLPASRIGRVWRIAEADLERFMDEAKTERVPL